MNFQFRLVAEGFTVLGAIIYLVLEIKDVLITQGITAQLITLVSLLVSYARISQSCTFTLNYTLHSPILPKILGIERLPIILVSNLPRGRAPGFLAVRAGGLSLKPSVARQSRSGTVETKMAARTGGCSTATILRKFVDCEQSFPRQKTLGTCFGSISVAPMR